VRRAERFADTGSAVARPAISLLAHDIHSFRDITTS
jgi:hypothetical protein